LAQFKAWLDHQKVNEKSKLGQAIRYTLNQWDRLNVYCEDGRLAIDNNAMENSIRPFAVGRRAWLFAATPKGQQQAPIYTA
jgi:transposase